MKKSCIVFLMAMLCLKATAQVTGEVNVLDRDVFYFNYNPPNIISDDFNYQRFSGKLSVPPIRKGKLSLFNTLGMDVHYFDYNDDSVGERNTDLQTLYNLNLSVFAQYKFSDRWSLNALAAPFVASNFEGNLSADDWNFNGNIYLERTFYLRSGGYLQAAIGAAYITLNGTTTFVPVTHLKARLNKEWSFVLGLPNTYVKWDINQKHSLKALMDLNDISANIGSSVNSLPNANRAIFTVASVGLEYNYWITSSVGVIFRATHGVWDNYELRDADNNVQYEFDSSLKQPFVSVGVKFNPIRKLQNSLNPL